MTERKKVGIAPSPATPAEQFLKAAQDMERAIGGRAIAIGARDYAADGFTRQKIVCNRGPIHAFWGRLLGQHTTNPNGNKTKWTEIRLWETPSGQWVAESVGCSNEPGHVDIPDALVIRGPVVLIDRQILAEFENRTPQTLSMEDQAMEFWTWSSPAKALAKKLGWNITIEVD